MCTIVALFTTAFAGQAWGQDFSQTYSYGESTWERIGFTDEKTYYKSKGSDDCIASIAGIFTGKNIVSDVKITLSVATYGNGDNPTSAKFEIYNSSECETKVEATQSGSLPSSSSFVNTIYTVTKAYATANFTNDIAIKVLKGTKLIRLKSIKIEFTYTSDNAPSLVVSPSSIAFGEKAINTTTTETFSVTYANLTEDLNITVGSDLSGVTVSPTTISKDATSPQNVTITYAPTSVGNISGNITVSNSADEVSQTVAVSGSTYDPSVVPTYTLFTGAIEEGDYIIYYNGKAMKNSVSSSRFQYEEVTPENDAITTSNASIVWHIAPNGDYWTIYSSDAGKYAAGTDSKNQGALINNVTDLAKWTVTVSDGVYQFENLGRSQASSDSGNKWLRNNGVNGFACYSSGTGGALSLYKLDDGTPSISASDVTLAYDATSGSITYTLTNPVEGTTLAAEVTEGDWLTLGNVAATFIPFTCEANTDEERTATVKLTYGTITKDVTVTQAAAPVVYSTIPALFEAATSTETDVTINFGGWVISAVKNSNAYLTDNQGHGLIIYANEHGFQVNDVLTGTVSCKLQLYRGSAELTEFTSTTEGLTITHDGTVSAQTIEISELNGVNTGALVSYERLTYTGSELKDANGNTITPYNTLFTGTFENGKIYNVTGIYLQYNSTKELLPRSADDIVEVLEPSIVADNVHIACDATSGEISYTINNPVEGTNLTATEEVEWISNLAVDATNNKVTFTTTANTGAERSGVITLTYGSVTKEVTVSQAVYTITSTYTLATSIVSGKHYVIASGEEDKSPGVVNVMATQKDNNRGATYGTLNGNDLSVSGHAELVIYGPDANGFYSIYDAVEGGYLYAASSSSNYLRTQANNNDNGLWTISIDETGIATITAQGDKTRNKMRYNSQNSVFSCYGSGQDDIYLYVKDGEETPNESVTVSNAGYATYCSENALDFTNSQIKAFIGTRNGTSLVFNPINKVPANTGILLYKVGGATEQIPVATTVDNATGNCLVGVTEQTTITADDYILSRSSDGVGFYKAGTHTTLAAKRAYISASTATGIKSFAINFGDADGVKEIGNGQLTIDNAHIYNLAGQRLQKLQKGVNIIGGKKVVVK